MIDAWKYYAKNSAVILFVVEDVTYNICDQRFHEFKIREMNPDIKVIRRNLTQIYQTAKLGEDKQLFMQVTTICYHYICCVVD